MHESGVHPHALLELQSQLAPVPHCPADPVELQVFVQKWVVGSPRLEQIVATSLPSQSMS